AGARAPLLCRRDHLPLPNVLPQHQQHVLRLVLVGEVEVLATALQVETLHAGVEVDQAHGHAGDADDGQPGPVALALDEPTLLDVQVERVGKDVNGVKADFLGHADAVGGVLAGLGPRRVDKPEFHGEGSLRTTTDTAPIVAWAARRVQYRLAAALGAALLHAPPRGPRLTELWKHNLSPVR